MWSYEVVVCSVLSEETLGKAVIRMSIVENAGKCPRCGGFVIAEESESHVCNIPTKGAETIFLDWIGDGFTHENGDHIRMAKGLNGILYKVILCKHNPPHSAKERPPDKLPMYPLQGVPQSFTAYSLMPETSSIAWVHEVRRHPYLSSGR
jgi:hypothetical protein